MAKPPKSTKRTLTLIGLLAAIIVLGVVTYISLNGGIFETRSKAGTRNFAVLKTWNFNNDNDRQGWRVSLAKTRVRNGRLVLNNLSGTTASSSSNTSLSVNYRMNVHPSNVLEATLTFVPNSFLNYSAGRPADSSPTLPDTTTMAKIDPDIDFIPIEPTPTVIDIKKKQPIKNSIDPTRRLIVSARYVYDKQGSTIDLGSQILEVPSYNGDLVAYQKAIKTKQTISFPFPQNFKPFTTTGTLSLYFTSEGGLPNSVSFSSIRLLRLITPTPTPTPYLKKTDGEISYPTTGNDTQPLPNQ